MIELDDRDRILEWNDLLKMKGEINLLENMSRSSLESTYF